MSKHQKRLSAPRSWKIERKRHHWTVKPRPGPHSKDAVPLLLIVRDILHLADNAREAKRVLKEGKILIDGRPRRDHKFPVGIFDIISIPLIEKHFIVLPDRERRLIPREIDEEEARAKLCKIENKTMVKGGEIQLNLHDGKNILGSTEMKTGDSVLLSVPENKILDRFVYQEGSEAIVVGGRHSGEIGRIKEIKKLRSALPNMVKIEGDGQTFETIEDYIFVVGEALGGIRTRDLVLTKDARYH